MAWVGALIGGGLGLIGGVLGNESREDTASEQTEFQREMSNSSYERQVADMKAAGLNPMLAYTKMGGASTPSGAQAVVEDVMTPSINSGVAAARVAAEIKNMMQVNENLKSENQKINAETALAETAAAKNQADTAVASVMLPKIEQETRTSVTSADLNTANADLAREGLRKINAEVARIIEESHLTAIQAEKVWAEIDNVKKQGGLIDAQTGNTVADTKLRNLSLWLGNASVPKAMNEENAQSSWWMKNVSPYLPDFLKSASSAAGFSKALK